MDALGFTLKSNRAQDYQHVSFHTSPEYKNIIRGSPYASIVVSIFQNVDLSKPSKLNPRVYEISIKALYLRLKNVQLLCTYKRKTILSLLSCELSIRLSVSLLEQQIRERRGG